MTKDITISLDAFGGDQAPEVNIQGALDFVQESKAKVILTGPEDRISKLLGNGHSQISVVHAPDLIGMAEKPSSQLRHRTESSMFKCIDLVAQNKADACVSAGSSGAYMALSLLLLKRLGDVERPALITPMPTMKDPCLCLDMGANVDCKPIHLVHFALMGHAYAQVFRKLDRPKIALMSNGEEEEKGNDLTRSTHQILKKIPEINYVGYCEGRDIFTGDIDVIVSDGFVGNVILKTAEGLAETLMGFLRVGFEGSWKGNISYLLMKPFLKQLKSKLDYAQYGGAPLLGIGKVSIVCHGRSTRVAIKNALHTAERNVRENLVGRLEKALNTVPIETQPQEALK